MNNTMRTLAIVVLMLTAATLVVGPTTTQSAVYADKKGDGNNKGNTVTIQKNKQDPTQSGFDNSFEEEAQNDICTHPSASCEAPQPTTGTLFVSKSCTDITPCLGIPPPLFSIEITGNNPQPSTIFIGQATGDFVTLGLGTFTIVERSFPGLVSATFSGDCTKVGPFTATGTISVGQHLTCTITNTVS